MDTLTLTRPDDWHLHLRDGSALRAVAPHSARQFARAIVMPNLRPPVTTTEQALAYRARILDAIPTELEFQPLMTLYLTDNTPPAEITRAQSSGHIHACKLYPAGATTNSDSGVTDVRKIHPVLEAMQAQGLPLLIHGEVTDPDVDIFDREAMFIDRVLNPIVCDFPALKIVLEHITTQDAADYVRVAPATVAATITAHHLLYNRNAIFQGGIRPHYYCLPVAKREEHRLALRSAATSGDRRFFLGTDSAPHSDPNKETACGCAGIFTAPNTLSCLAHVFEEDKALEKLEAFTSLNGPAFYGLEPNEDRITLVKRDEPVACPEKIHTGDGDVTVFDPMFPLYWDVQ